jgi:T5SS/PEP-CTERM-associated repeat protein
MVAFGTLVAIGAPRARAVVVPWAGANNADWTSVGAWPTAADLTPKAASDEAAAINNGTTAVVSTNLTGANAPAGLILGQAAGNTGTVAIQTGGTLATAVGAVETGAAIIGAAATGTVTLSSGGAFNPVSMTIGRDAAAIGTVTVANGSSVNVSGALQVGLFGRGTLTVAGGGSVTAGSLNSSGVTGATPTTIQLGDTSGLTATMTSNGATSLLRTTQVTGPNVNFTSTGPLTLSTQHTLVADIRNAATHSALKSTSAASVGGTLRLQFTGVTPTLGNMWNVVNATSIAGNFGALDASAAPALPVGQAYTTRIVNGGNGKLLQVGVEQLLTLQVNRSTGAMWLVNSGPASAAATVALDGYTVTAPNGGLNAAAPWLSLADQGLAGWQEIPGAPNALSEVNTSGTLSLLGGQVRSLGTPFTPIYTGLGSDPDNLTFTYTTPNGQRTGRVEYFGIKQVNNLVVTVDAATGVATLKNDSPNAVSIVGYSIQSVGGALKPANGQWNSLTDQGTPNFAEAAPTVNALSELATNSTATFTLAGNATRTLGNLFDITKAKDLVFTFQLPGAFDGQAGLVKYASPFTADFNFDSKVDALDLAILKNNYGPSSAGDADGDGDTDSADFLIWQRQNGSHFPATAAGAAVPEPASWLLVGLAAAPAWNWTRRRRGAAAETQSPTRNTENTRRRTMHASQAPSARPRIVAAALVAMTLIVAASRARAADILLVSRPAQFGASDQELMALLKGFGHTIVNEASVLNNTADFRAAPPTAAQLVGVDVVLFSRNNNSGDFTDTAGEAAAWNAITTPLVAMSPQILRGGVVGLANTAARFGWVNSTTIIDNQPAPTNFDAFPDANHPFVAGRTTSVFPAGQSIDYFNFTANELPFGATLVATMTIGVNTFPSIVDIPANTVAFGDTNGNQAITAGRRVFLQMLEYPDTTDVFALSTNGGQILNQIITTVGGALSSPDGDVDGDGDADINDFNIIKANWRTAVANRTMGDLNGDGFVDLVDFRIWKDNDPLRGEGASFGVPEPSSAALLLAGLATAAGLRRRRRARRGAAAEVGRRSFIGRAFAGASAAMAIALLTAGVAQGKTIAFISYHFGGADPAMGVPTTAAMNAGFTESPDIGYTNILTGMGHSVTRFQQSGTPDVGTLSTFDLVVVSRSVPSGSFQTDAQTGLWNSITAPMIVLNGYASRQSRLGFLDGSDDIPDSTGALKLTIAPTQLSHPIFAGVSRDANGVMTNNYTLTNRTSPNNVVQRGTSISAQAVDAAGTLLATTTVGTTANGKVIAEFPSGAAITNAGASPEFLGGKRLMFVTGSRENDGGSGEIAGMYDLDRDGTMMYVNAVQYMLGLSRGDVDNNGVVDLADFAAIRDNFQKSVTTKALGDLTMDGKVDFRDYYAWRSNFTGVVPAWDPVPEPGAAALAFLGVAALGAARRRNRA